MKIRAVRRQTTAQPTTEGAGVHLHRAFGFGTTAEFDPFLLLDDFRNDHPSQYEAGFPWHPHRGIETITYVLAGSVEHQDSLGNKGRLGPGDIQWMTAGNGIVHQEMPSGDAEGRVYGFQLWANLPASLKRMTPRYQEIKSAEIPVVRPESGIEVRIICGEFSGVSGPVHGVAANPTYMDIHVAANHTLTVPMSPENNGFAYVFSGSGIFGEAETVGAPVSASQAPSASEATNRTLVLFGEGDAIRVRAGSNGIRFILAFGKPLREQIGRAHV